MFDTLTPPARHGVHRVARDHCLAPSRTVDAPSGGARYGRMFPSLAALPENLPALESAGEPGGVCDAAALLARAGAAAEDATEAAGWPFFGQIVAHDITADRSPVGPHADVAALRNARAPKLNLEMIYGDGPVGAPYLYDRHDPARMLLGPDGWDVPRNSQGVALIGDPRNDVHLFANRLHVALLHAHNALVARLRDDGVPGDLVFEEARRALTWHYQWAVVHDFLPRLVGRSLVAEVLDGGGRWFAPALGEAFLPLEFADAAYRYGHGQIRESYRLQDDAPAFPLFPDLVGFAPVPPEHHVDLGRLFDLPGRPPAQRAKRLDGGLPASLLGLPEQVTGDVPEPAYRSLAVRDLLRGAATGLPSGETVAAELGVVPLTPEEAGPLWPEGTPLWLYVLKEAEHRGSGNRLGPVGGRIVAEVLIGLLRADGGSWLVVDPGWQPSLPRSGTRFTLADLLVLADAERATAPPVGGRA